ncbi:hypothetical protein Ahy_B05g075430 isoform B [Arachis hypogaea]|uniref:Aminotransferase-like plant mobile domain-containing protein n=1 Tax=Arachis hypogaea TaxID=3818 RepID=A0A444Z1J8_ARAHY|nr:hypothetical protein Ahy_B05g075430 isoform B [Arachis hypogaea]
MVRKLDPPQTCNPMVENYLRSIGFYHVSRIGFIKQFYPLLAALVEMWRLETHTFVLPVGESQSIAIFRHELAVSSSSKSYIKLGCVRDIRDAEQLDTEESIKRYVRCQIFCFLGSTLFTDKSIAYVHAKYLPLLRDFEWIHTYSWGSTCLAHLYRGLCRASQYDAKEMDDHLNLLFVWAWERLPCIAPIPRQSLPPVVIPEIDYMDEFVWRLYEGLIIPDELHGHLEVCDIVAPLLSFECAECHSANRIMRQFGYAQPPPPVAREILLREHCITLCGAQLYDWTVLHGDG